ncbi:MAG: class I SAM-dependent methyltransferase [Chloroflexi bacterium]|nr:class I SAM-dependent methyltransferase [Chloroflexota bacterium]
MTLTSNNPSQGLTNQQHGHPERIVPDETAPGIVAIHLKRYDFARGYVAGKHVLDVACGVGYGSHYLSEAAASVTGLDLDTWSVEYARERYGDRPSVTFEVGNALDMPFETGQFDVVCSFETIEHVQDADAFLREVLRVLKPGGVFIVSTPAARISTQRPDNPHHVQEWSPKDFERLLRNYFADVTIYSQARRTTRLAEVLRRLDVFKLRARVPLAVTRQVAASAGVRTMGDVDLNDIEIRSGVVEGASESVVVCRRTGDDTPYLYETLR